MADPSSSVGPAGTAPGEIVADVSPARPTCTHRRAGVDLSRCG